MGIATPPPFDNVLNTPVPTAFQQETTAATDIARQSMGIVPQDTFQTFTEVNKHLLWKYDTTPGHPTLAPLSQTRTGKSDELDEKAWQNFISTIVDTLPKEIQDKLAEMHRLTPEQRNPEFFENYDSWRSLEELIKFAAKTEYFITYTSILSTTENFKNEAALNSQVIDVITDGMVKSAREYAQMIKEDLAKRLNDPEKDPATYLLTYFELLMNEASQAAEAA